MEPQISISSFMHEEIPQLGGSGAGGGQYGGSYTGSLQTGGAGGGSTPVDSIPAGQHIRSAKKPSLWKYQD